MLIIRAFIKSSFYNNIKKIKAVIMAETKKEVKIETVKQDYYYTFLTDTLEMVRDYCCFIHNDKKLLKQFNDILDYVYSKFPDIDGEDIEYELLVKIT